MPPILPKIQPPCQSEHPYIFQVWTGWIKGIKYINLMSTLQERIYLYNIIHGFNFAEALDLQQKLNTFYNAPTQI